MQRLPHRFHRPIVAGLLVAAAWSTVSSARADSVHWSMYMAAVGNGRQALAEEYTKILAESTLGICTNERGWMQAGPDGSALLVAEAIASDGAAAYIHALDLYRVRANGTVQRERIDSWNDTKATCARGTRLVLDSLGASHLFRSGIRIENGALVQFVQHATRVGSGWRWREVPLGFSPNLMRYAVAPGRDGALHLLAADDTRATALAVYHYAYQAGTWRREQVALVDHAVPTTPMELDIVQASDGTVHAAFGLEYLDQGAPSGARQELWHASNGDGGWRADIVAGPADSADFAGNHPDIDLLAASPLILAMATRHAVPGGSLLDADLFFFEAANGGWRGRLLVEDADGFCWDDGCSFTGLSPSLATDREGGTHVLFQDEASSHPQGWAVLGQMRYGYRAPGGGWRFSTVYRQPPPQSRDDFSGLDNPVLAVTADGAHAFAAGVQHEANGGRHIYRLVLLHLLPKAR